VIRTRVQGGPGDIDLADVTEPLVACPMILTTSGRSRPSPGPRARGLHRVLHDQHRAIRAAGRILDKAGPPRGQGLDHPPTKMDAAQLMREGFYAIFVGSGGRTEMPGCSLCMGNQARVAPDDRLRPRRPAISTTGSATMRASTSLSELAALTALKGRIPTVENTWPS